MHMCKHVPDDPTMVLAVEINPITYNLIYHRIAVASKKAILSYDTIKGNMLVVPVDGENDWGHMSAQDFNELHRRPAPYIKAAPNSFVLYEVLVEKQTGKDTWRFKKQELD